MSPTDPPGPRGPALVRQWVAIAANPLAALRDLQTAYGGIVLLHLGTQRIYLLSDPLAVEDALVTHSAVTSKRLGNHLLRRLLGDGLITSTGDAHLAQRRLLQPVFHRQHVAEFGSVMVDRALEVVASWRDGDRLDVFEEMTRLSLAIIGSTLFAAEFAEHASVVRQALADVLSRVHLSTLLLGELADGWPIPTTPQTARAFRQLNEVLYSGIRAHRSAADSPATALRGDLVSLLITARDDQGRGLTDREVRDQAMSIFLAGFETMAVCLSWTWFLLAQDPTCEALLHEEVDRVLCGRSPTAADAPGLPYTRRILTESLRLYPPIWLHGRRAAADLQVAGYAIPAGSHLVVNHWLMHRDPRYFPNPDRFEPDRWAVQSPAQGGSGARGNLPRLAFAPFSAGPRRCIGEGFAWLEGVLCLAALAQRWRFTLAPGDQGRVEPVLTLRPRDGLRMVVRSRRRPGDGESGA